MHYSMKRDHATLSLFCCLIMFAVTATSSFAAEEKKTEGAAPRMQMITAESGEAFIIPECECLALMKDSVISILAVLEPAKRPDKYRTIDIQKGDVLMMLNGKKLTDATFLRTMYDSLAMGAEIKLGLKRNGKPMIVSFQKGEPIEGGNMKMVLDTEGGAPGQQGGQRVMKQFAGGEDFDEIDALVPLGILVGISKGKAVVADLLPMAGEVYGEKTPATKDELVSIDGKPIKGMEAIESLRPSLVSAKKGTVVVRRDGKELTFNYVVPNELPQIMMKKH